MRTKLSTCPPPVWGEMAKWVGGRVGTCRRGWDKSLGPTVEGRIWERPPPRKQLNLPQHARPMRKKKKKAKTGFRKKSSNWFLQYFFFYSCVFFPPPSLFETLKLESSAAAALLFFSLADLYTLWNPAWKIQKKRKILLMIIATMRIYCMWGGNFIQSYLLWSFLSFSLFLQMPFCFSFSLSSFWVSFLFHLPLKFLQRSGRCCISTKNKTFPFACLSVYFESDACHWYSSICTSLYVKQTFCN